jgi:hypothetical protein
MGAQRTADAWLMGWPVLRGEEVSRPLALPGVNNMEGLFQRHGLGHTTSKRCARAVCATAVQLYAMPLGGLNKLAYKRRSSCRRNAKPICNGHGVCGTHVPHHFSPIVVWTHSNDRVTIHTHVGYEMGRYTS